MFNKAFLMTSLFILNCYVLPAQVKHSNYNILHKIPVTGNGGWDYLCIDDSTHRLFISHNTMVQVMDLKDKRIVGVIHDTKGVHGIALANDMNKGFISSGKDSSVTIFNLETLATIEKIKVNGKNPDAILYDPFTQRVFSFNGGSNNATVIDAKENKVIGNIDLKGKPEFAVSNGSGRIYVNIEDKSVVNVINPATLKIEKVWKIAPGIEPSGMAIDIEEQRLFIVCDNKLMIILDAVKGKVITSLPIGDHVDGVAYDPELKRAFSSNGDGTMTIVQEKDKNTFEVVENVPTQIGARTICIDKKSHHLYLPVAEFGSAPPTTAENPHAKPTVAPGTFIILEVAPVSEKGN